MISQELLEIARYFNGCSCELTCFDDAVDEVLPRDEVVVVLVHLAEEVGEPRLLVVHELEEALPPVVPREVGQALLLLEVPQVLLEPPLALPGREPDRAPPVVQEAGRRSAEHRLRALAATSRTKGLGPGASMGPTVSGSRRQMKLEQSQLITLQLVDWVNP